jgi:hypothetical protein
MPPLWEAVQQIASVTRHVAQLQTQVQDVRGEVRALRQDLLERVHAVELEVAALRTEAKAQRETQRETVRAEIATAVAELRVRYAEEQARRRLDEG